MRTTHIEELNTTANRLDVIVIYKALYPATEYAFLSSAHTAVPNTDYILGHETNLNKYK